MVSERYIGEKKNRIESMGLSGRRAFLIGLGFSMALGISLYFKLWSIDFNSYAEGRDFIRKQFDFANMEAKDESAAWRLRYDAELERSSKCAKELVEAKVASEKAVDKSAGIKEKLFLLQQENIDLLDRVEYMSQELQDSKLNCSVHR